MSYVDALIDTQERKIKALQEENAKLRELVKDMWKSIVALCGWRYANNEYLDRVNELGTNEGEVRDVGFQEGVC